MKKRKLLLIGLLISNINSVLGQSCGTPHPINPTIYPQEDTSLQARGSSSALCIEVFFHIVRNTNGTNAFTTPNLDAIVNDLNEFYSSHNIIINNAGTSFIDNSNNLHVDFDEAKTIANSRNQNGVINYYIVDDMEYNGFALDIPSDALFIRDNRIYTSTSAHELGHCLGLYHTHRGLAYGESGCAEAINGNNCNDCGDLVCDTPADNGEVNTNDYAPDLTNIMSYFHLYGYNRDHFTNGQGYRMRYAIRNESVLQDIEANSCTSISEVNNVCYPQTTTISLNNVVGATTSWTSSSNVQIVSSNNISAEIRSKYSNSSGNGWIRAILSNGIEFTEEFEVGLPKTESISIHKAGSFKLYNNTWNWIHARYNGSYDYNIPNWEWRFFASQGVSVMTRNAYKSTIHVRPTADGTLDIQARVSNECGCSGWRSKVFQIGNGSGSTGTGPGLEW